MTPSQIDAAAREIAEADVDYILQWIVQIDGCQMRGNLPANIREFGRRAFETRKRAKHAIQSADPVDYLLDKFRPILAQFLETYDRIDQATLPSEPAERVERPDAPGVWFSGKNCWLVYRGTMDASELLAKLVYPRSGDISEGFWVVSEFSPGNWVPAVPATAPADRWRPIYTAPKDGTRVLLFAPDYGQCVGTWIPTSEGGSWISGEWDVEPTSWMPLPQHPEVKHEA